MVACTPATEPGTMQQPAGTASHGQSLTLLLSGGLLLTSLALSWWASGLSLVYLPAADVWQHTALLTQAAAGHLDASSLLQKHNGLHFIPLPKLVYALDLALFAGSGLLTAGMSAVFTLLCCVLFAGATLRSSIPDNEKKTLSLLAGSWLVCALQWESFVNPANLQWSGLNAGLVLTAVGLQRRGWLLAAGGVLAIGCGAPWWLWLLAVCAVQLPSARLLTALALALATGLLWDGINGYVLHALPPLPLLALNSVMPVRDEDLAALTLRFFDSPAVFYRDWLGNLLSFISSFCLPGLERLLPASAMRGLAPLPVLAWIFLIRPQDAASKAFRFLITATLLVCLAAGMTRAQLPGAYTLRFANTGLLFASAVLVLARLAFPHRQGRIACWLIAILFSTALGLASLHEAASIVHGSNQRRLSQVAYALDIHDPRATSETPFAPLMEQSYREINERKGILANHNIGIYHSRAHRIFTGAEALPAAVTSCSYDDIAIKNLRDDDSARKITGQTQTSAGDAMDSILLRDSAGRAIGYGIVQISGSSVIGQLASPRRWAGFLHRPADGVIDVIAYNRRQQCQSFRLTLP